MSKSTVTAMGYRTIEDQSLIKCWQTNKKYEANHFLKMLPDCPALR